MNRYLLVVGEMESKLRAEHGTREYRPGQADQIRAASEEMEALVIETAFEAMDRYPGSTFHESEGVINFRAAALVMAAFHLADMRLCVHSTTIQPVLALMAHRVIVCRACLEYTRGAPPVIPADRCDWCGESEPSGQFAPVTIRYNHMTAIGDACSDCHPQFIEAYNLGADG